MTRLSTKPKQDPIPVKLRYGSESSSESDIEKDEPIEIETIEIPVVKRMSFQFNKPVKLEFS
jgi:hypothetical protein